MIRPQVFIILKDLRKKTVFLTGPQQSGKTTLAKQISKSYSNPLYFQCNPLCVRSSIDVQSWPFEPDLLILDDLCSLHDLEKDLEKIATLRPELHILVTSSMRIAISEKMRESAICHRLLPLSLAELKQSYIPTTLDNLLGRTGFPEPFFGQGGQAAVEQWRVQYIQSLLSDNQAQVQSILHMKSLLLLFEALRHRVGSPISYQSLSEEIGLCAATVKKYVGLLEANYVIFILKPYSKNIARSLIKEPKIYFFDTGLVQGGEQAALENLVAVSLLKEIYTHNDQFASELELHYLRTKDKEEVDFAISLRGELIRGIDVTGEGGLLARSLLRLQSRYGFEGIQLWKDRPLSDCNQGIKAFDSKSYLESLFL